MELRILRCLQHMTPFEIFIRDCIARLKGIAASSKGDASVEDLKNEAWVMAHEWEAKKGSPLNLALPEDQESMLSQLYGKFVRTMKTKIGLALRLDMDWDKGYEEAGPRLGDTLEAPELSDPLKALEQREDLSPLELACLKSYSQATAYAVCLHRWDSPTLANYLGIKIGTLRERIRYWKAWIEYQPSIFDGIEQICPDFMPLRRVCFVPDAEVSLHGEQWAWGF